MSTFLSDLDKLGQAVVKALVRQVADGSVPAARAALAEVERARKTRLGEAHQERLEALAGDPVELARYLGSLGLDRVATESRIGHRMTKSERDAWEHGEEDRLLEVRAVELGRMRHGNGDVPRWATRRAT